MSAPTVVRTADRRRVAGGSLIVVLVAALAVLCVVAAGIGAYRIPPGEVVAAIGRRLGLLPGLAADPIADAVFWEVRAPRVVLAVLVGLSLGMAGAVMQGVFGNPLAEPGIVGVSAGAAVGAALAIVAGLSTFGSWSIVVPAFIGGLLATSAVYALSRSDGRTEVVTLVLTGIAVNAVAGAVIGLLIFVADDAQLRSITFWNLGSVGTATWRSVAAVAPWAFVGLVVVPLFARQLDLLALGESAAGHLGVDVERLRAGMVLAVALLTAAAVAVAGIISFVGLVVPHAIRMIAGPGHRLLLPASALAGAIVMVAADLVARTAAAPVEIPLGILTALLGGPCFFWLLRRTRSQQGGWG